MKKSYHLSHSYPAYFFQFSNRLHESSGILRRTKQISRDNPLYSYA
jgi:hypothetical protein